MGPFPVMSKVVSGFDATDGGAPRVCAYGVDGATPWPSTATVNSGYEMFLQGLKVGTSNKCLGYRPFGTDKPYKWNTYEEVHGEIVALSQAIRTTLGVQTGARVGIIGKNSPNWTRVQYASSAAGAVLVPLYPSLGADAVEYICGHAEPTVVFVSEENLASILAIWDRLTSVACLVVFGRAGAGELEDQAAFDAAVAAHGADKVRSFGDVLSDGKGMGSELDYTPAVDDLFIIMYTSGTTGRPKGVMLQNKAFVAAVAAGRLFNDHWITPFGPADIYFSFLPLAHILAQQQEAMYLSSGTGIGYYSGDIKLLVSDLDALKPTLFAGVPRVYARFEEKIRGGLEEASKMKKKLFDYAFQTQLHNVRSGLPRSWFWDFLVFNKIKAKVFPELRMAVTGGAPMSADTNDFLKVCLNVPLVQGYGLTETTAGVLCCAPLQSESGTCGGLMPKTELKLVDVPDMDYLTTDKPRPRGEVYIRGESVMLGYFKNPEETEKAFPIGDGWFATGDIGTWNDDGTLVLIDRRKNLFKLAQGEYVAPDNLEQEYAKAKFVSQIFVYGNSLEATLVAVVVPNKQLAVEWGEKNRKLSNIEDIVKVPAFKKEILTQLEELRVSCKFHKYEGIRDVYIEGTGLNELSQGFHVENDLMTPTFKLKRPQLKNKYKDRLEELYAAMKETK